MCLTIDFSSKRIFLSLQRPIQQLTSGPPLYPSSALLPTIFFSKPPKLSQDAYDWPVHKCCMEHSMLSSASVWIFRWSQSQSRSYKHTEQNIQMEHNFRTSLIIILKNNFEDMVLERGTVWFHQNANDVISNIAGPSARNSSNLSYSFR